MWAERRIVCVDMSKSGKEFTFWCVASRQIEAKEDANNEDIPEEYKIKPERGSYCNTAWWKVVRPNKESCDKAKAFYDAPEWKFVKVLESEAALKSYIDTCTPKNLVHEFDSYGNYVVDYIKERRMAQAIRKGKLELERSTKAGMTRKRDSTAVTKVRSAATEAQKGKRSGFLSSFTEKPRANVAETTGDSTEDDDA